MSGSELLWLSKIAAANLSRTALPGSSLSQVLARHGKLFGAAKKVKPVVGKGLSQSGLAQPEKIV